MKTLIIAVVVGAIAAATAAFAGLDQLLRAYLAGWVFWTGVSVGSLGLLLLHGVTGGAWGEAMHPPLVRAAAFLPWLAILALPVIAGTRLLYGPSASALFLALRIVLYFAAWAALWVAVQRRPELTPVALIAFIFASTLAWSDLLMILGGWISTMFGILTITGNAAAALSMALLLSARRDIEEQHSAAYSAGNLLLALVLVWTYLVFSQFLVVWLAGLPEDARWYLPRIATPWRYFGAALVAGHIVVPSALLFFRFIRRSFSRMRIVALAVVVMQALHVIWVVEPSFTPAPRFEHVAHVLFLVAFGLVWWSLLRFAPGLWPHVSALPGATDRAKT